MLCEKVAKFPFPHSMLAEPPACSWLTCTPFTPVTAEERADACKILARLYQPSHHHLHARHTHSLASQSNASKITIWQKNTVKLEKAGLNIARHSPSLPIFNTNGLTYGGDRKKRRTKDTFDELTEGKLLPDFARSLLDHFSESFVRKTIGAKHT